MCICATSQLEGLFVQQFLPKKQKKNKSPAEIQWQMYNNYFNMQASIWLISKLTKIKALTLLVFVEI